VHGTALAFTDSSRLSENFSHHPVDIRTKCDRLAMPTMGSHTIVMIAHRKKRSHGGRLFTDAKMAGAMDFTFGKECVDGLLKFSDQPHSPVHLDQDAAIDQSYHLPSLDPSSP
jgi:hypothetical protein